MKKIEQNSVKTRLKEFLKYKKLSQKKFEEICGFSNGYVNSMRKSIKSETYDEQVAPNFPELNKVWLLLGEGEMLKSSNEDDMNEENNTNISKQNKLKEIFKIIEKYNVSNYEISKNTGISEAGLGSITNGETKNPREITVNSIYNYLVEKYESLPQGEMLKSSEESPVKGDEVKAVPFDNYMMVEYADLSTAAGLLGGDNPYELPETKTRLVPKEFDSGKYLVVTVYGDSMDDGTSISIPHGTEILIKQVFLSQNEKLPIRNNLFVIVTSEGNTFKQIIEHNSEEGYIICRAYNKNYSDFKLSLENVLQIFVFRKIVSFRPFIPEIN
ncbi:S24 family peptidase [Riemerella columbina]|uniref:S24 family peptidase n=1 Tax=Riemerella columbina TaxID=103810 RepID=UPI0003744F97|nr:S24 family peptidase [Riemerella columbina]